MNKHIFAMEVEDRPFKLVSKFEPSGDQPQAIEQLVKKLKEGKQHQILLGATGTGKSLPYGEPIFVRGKDGFVRKVSIGEFVERRMKTPKILGDTEYEPIRGEQVLSFDQSNYDISEKDICEISRHKEKYVYKITLDDYSEVRVTKDHNCFKLEDAALQLIQTGRLRVGDYLPTARFIPESKVSIENINLLDYHDGKVSIKGLVERYGKAHKILKAFFKKEFKSPNWKIEQVLSESKERGVTKAQLKLLLKMLDITLDEASPFVRIITKGVDTLRPLVSVDKEFLAFSGLYLAEGHNTGKYILLSNSEADLQKQSCTFFKKHGVNFSQRNENDFQFNSKVFAQFFETFGSSSYGKQIPDFVYNLSNAQLKYLLRGFFDGDGWVEKSSVHAISASKELIFGIKDLLLRFGILSRISHKKVRYKGSRRVYFQINISGAENIEKFKKCVSFSIDYKVNKLGLIKVDSSNTNVDLMPQCGEFLKNLRVTYGLSQKDLSEKVGCARSHIGLIEGGKRYPSTSLFKQILKFFKSIGEDVSRVHHLTHFNFRKIISIEKDLNPTGFVYDISVKDNENFIAGFGNIFVHNTFTMANVINQLQRPTLILAHNKTLAAQLCAEFQEFFPENAVSYFVSYYDYYQPEAYLPASDTYIAKDASINDEINKYRHTATMNLLTRRDVIIIASVSCIYGLGSVEDYEALAIKLKVGENMKRDVLLRRLTDIQYTRSGNDFKPGMFHVLGDVVEVFPPSSDENVFRLEFFGDELENIVEADSFTGEVVSEMTEVTIFPAKHSVTTQEKVEGALGGIEAELAERHKQLLEMGKIVEAERIKTRTEYDIDMLRETGYVTGIENYVRYFDYGGQEGRRPTTLMDYFPDDFILFIDESHITVPQIGGMYGGNYSRKKNLVEHGFRLPSAFDNRPLEFPEFEEYMRQVTYVSATPNKYEYEHTKKEDIAEQIVRPTGLIDPEVQVKSSDGQIADIISEIEKTVKREERVLITTLTKKSAERLTEYLVEAGIKVRYLHSDIDTMERIEILRDLRLGKFDVLVGINLLREGLDLPEVSFIAILDADKQGFLRSVSALIQTIGRAARNVNGHVTMYTSEIDGELKITDAMQGALDETARRREIQMAYNEQHGITPATIKKAVKDITMGGSAKGTAQRSSKKRDSAKIPKEEIKRYIEHLENEMDLAAQNMEFEKAAELRDEIDMIRQENGMMGVL